MYKFDVGYNYKTFRRIIEDYPEPIKTPAVYWWYKKTSFGFYLLGELCMNPTLNRPDLPDIPEKDWYHFIPVLKEYFVTYKEFQNIVNNVYYLKGFKQVPIEDTNFITYVLIKQFGKMSYDEILELPYKQAMILYLYSIAVTIINKEIAEPMKSALESMFG